MSDSELSRPPVAAQGEAGNPAGAQNGADLEAAKYARNAYKRVMAEMEKVVVGQRRVITEMLMAIFARGHCLVVGVPGLAKTLIVRTLAQVFDLKFSRIQFTPDLMPSDIIGTDIAEEDPETKRRFFKFFHGPVFANIVLADEINRTPPKTQAALLEAMQESHVTAGGETYPLPLPFFVLATQNPIEQEGTYPLPEAQQDRFMFNVFIDYPAEEEEMEIVNATTSDREPQVKVVMGANEILALQRSVRQVPVTPHVVQYATRLVRATRPNRDGAPDFVNEYLAWGAGPRAAQYLILGAKAWALLSGKYAVTCTDIRNVAPSVLRHRLFTNFNADAEGLTADKIIARLLKTIPQPSEKDYR
ncbi:MAG: MoxR family ATPase [Candidatus Hydrogenedentes bacterium]|nr:MoxR family ATPase [Candidatus Hydrogenedentota bacterium]